MPAIEFLDNLTDFDQVTALDTFISTAPAIIAVLSAAFLCADVWNVIKKLREQKRIWTGLWIVGIIVQLLVITLAILCVLYKHDGRYSHNDISGYNSTRYYFGQINNGQPNGFGKEFTKDKTIYFVGNFIAGAANGDGRIYSEQDGIVYIKYEGEYKDNNTNGSGTTYELIAGEAVEIYTGEYKNGKYDGTGKRTYRNDDGTINRIFEGRFRKGEQNGWGTETKYDSGTVTYKYTGGWAKGKKMGFGTELEYNNGDIHETYQGTFWNDVRFGDGIWEYWTADQKQMVWVGFFTDGDRTENGSYYYAGGEFVPAEGNGTSSYNEETGEWDTNEEKKEELMKKWPYPTDELLMMELTTRK